MTIRNQTINLGALDERQDYMTVAATTLLDSAHVTFHLGGTSQRLDLTDPAGQAELNALIEMLEGVLRDSGAAFNRAEKKRAQEQYSRLARPSDTLEDNVASLPVK